MSERQATYAEQLVTLEAAQVTTAQHLSALEKQDQLLRQQLDEVSAVRAVRNAQFAQQLEQVQGQYAGSAGESQRADEAQAPGRGESTLGSLGRVAISEFTRVVGLSRPRHEQ